MLNIRRERLNIMEFYFTVFVVCSLVFSCHVVGAEYKSESDSNTDSEMAATTYPHEDAEDLGQEKSEESYQEWGKYWSYLSAHENQGVLDVVHGKDLVFNFRNHNFTNNKLYV